MNVLLQHERNQRGRLVEQQRASRALRKAAEEEREWYADKKAVSETVPVKRAEAGDIKPLEQKR